MACGTLKGEVPILAPIVCTRHLKAQTNQPNQTKPELHQQGVTFQMKQKAKRCPEIKSQVARVPPKDGKVMPQNQKPNGINAKHDFPVPLDLRPGKVSASSLFSFDIVSSNFLLIFCKEVTLSFAVLEASRYQSK